MSIEAEQAEGEAELEAMTAPPPTPEPFDRLTDRELEVVKLLAVGDVTRDIARKLEISTKTVDTHRGRALTKLKIRHNVDLARLALRVGLVSLFEE